MTVRSISVWPHEVLREVAEAVEDVHAEEVVQLVKDLRDTTTAYRAHGVAAPQIGVSKRVIIVRDGEIHRVLINPEYLTTSAVPITSFEGCLSFPGVRVKIKRADSVHISYLDEHGHAHSWEAEGLSAVAVQHEIDHLNGVVMIDHLSKLERNIALRRLKKVKKRLGAYAA